MSRRSPGEGSIVQRADGRWCGALQVGGRRQFVYGKTRSDVAEKLRKMVGQAGQNGWLPSAGNLTVENYLADWLAQAAAHLRPTTQADYAVMIHRHVDPTLGKTKLTRLSGLQLARFYATLGKMLRPRRVRMVHDLLHKSLGDAHRWGLLPSNPAATVEAPKRQEREPDLWTPEQVQRFLAAICEGKGGHYSPLLSFLLGAGCRIGEALGLRWEDVDWQAGAVRIERQVVQIGKSFHEGPPKTRSGVRTVVLPTFGLAALRQQRAANAEHLRTGPVWADEAGRVFVTTTGTTPERGNVKRALHKVCDRLGLPRISPHALRHLHLSLLAMNGVPLKAAQVRAGHSSPMVTLKVYQHVLGDTDLQAAKAIERAIGL